VHLPARLSMLIGDDHHQTVEASIEWSVRLLSDAERAAHGQALRVGAAPTER
jgi:hypothetical protein